MNKKYCECCGRKLSDIRKKLEDRDEWKGHRNYGDFIYGNLNIDYCGFCGEKLYDEWIKTGMGGMPRERIIVGYECKNCDSEVDF